MDVPHFNGRPPFSSLVAQIGWSHNLIVLQRYKDPLTGKKDRSGIDNGKKISPSPVSVINPVHFIAKDEKVPQNQGGESKPSSGVVNNPPVFSSLFLT